MLPNTIDSQVRDSMGNTSESPGFSHGEEVKHVAPAAHAPGLPPVMPEREAL